MRLPLWRLQSQLLLAGQLVSSGLVAQRVASSSESPSLLQTKLCLPISLSFEQTVLANPVAKLRIICGSIHFNVGAIVDPIVLRKPNHRVIARLQNRAPRQILVALQLKGVLSFPSGKNYDTVVYLTASYCNCRYVTLFLCQRLYRAGKRKTQKERNEQNGCFFHGSPPITLE
jgi:hypothetical protein